MHIYKGLISVHKKNVMGEMALKSVYSIWQLTLAVLRLYRSLCRFMSGVGLMYPYERRPINGLRRNNHVRYACTLLIVINKFFLPFYEAQFNSESGGQKFYVVYETWQGVFQEDLKGDLKSWVSNRGVRFIFSHWLLSACLAPRGIPCKIPHSKCDSEPWRQFRKFCVGQALHGWTAWI